MPNKRYKVTCALCKSTFNNDFTGKHCKLKHPKYNARNLPLVIENQQKIKTSFGLGTSTERRETEAASGSSRRL
ncbi:Uncharacterised protein g5170 [Pycnogonum litorale]